MNIITTLFGNIEVEEDQLYQFSSGLPGFEDMVRFALIQPNADEPFVYLQSVAEAGLNFILTNPFFYVQEYDFEVREHITEELQIADTSDIAVWSIVTVNSSLTEASINLLAPILLNVKTKLGKQIILHDTSYPVRYPILNDNTSSGEEDSHASTVEEKG
ncbi:flagellar assembly protein FliW [Paenibacillus sp. MBLB4367]|uniref:flagellar assembly protein FliW n=1 Tax=Paenibacillus sp. MBLB4367 TaxID=3384767 RepID=UPI003908381D